MQTVQTKLSAERQTVDIAIRVMTEKDAAGVAHYFLNPDTDYWINMGIDPQKLPAKQQWINLLKQELQKSDTEKGLYYVIWLIDNKPIGHSNINNITYGMQANMHIHLWESNQRQKGIGVELIKQSIAHFFEKFQLQNLYCEPSTTNPAPNKVLHKLGFTFIETYIPNPTGWIHLPVEWNKYVLPRKQYEQAFKK
jgi:RimJ/RimL family protein N-acetyltransferase